MTGQKGHGLKFRVSSFLFLVAVFTLPIVYALEATPVETYDQLVQAIRVVKRESRARIEAAARAEKVREAWETGKLIDEHILHHQDRAKYGAQVLKRLASDLEMSETELGYMLQFARTYPIPRPVGKLSWSHYEILLSVNDDVQRDAIAKQAEDENWSKRRLRAEVNKLLSGTDKDGARQLLTSEDYLAAEAGQIGTYKIIRAKVGPYKGQLMLDLGFSIYHMPETGLDGFEEGDFVISKADSLAKFEGASDADRYTYAIDVIKVLDGDTLNAAVDLGFGNVTVQTLRLRGLDAPEIESAEGMAAKEYLKNMLTGQGPVIIRSVKSDKYDRYLIDLWVEGNYVNQELVNGGYAVVIES